MKKGIFAVVAVILLSCFSSVWANHDSSSAKSVIENWFAAMKSGDENKAGSYLSSKFVSIHTDGMVRDKSQEMKLIKNLNMKEYDLTDFNFTQSGDVIVVTYKDKGVEKIDNKPIADKAAGRMAVLQKQNGKWLILAYANLDQLS